MPDLNFAEDQEQTLRTIGRVLSAFSIVSLLYIVILYTIYKKIRSFALELVVYLCISNIIYNISKFFPVNPNKIDLCIVQGTLSVFSDLSTNAWATIVGYSAFVSFRRQDHIDNNKCLYRIIFFFIAYGWPLTAILL